MCEICAGDKFHIIRVFREKRLKDGKWLISNNYDTRLVVCRCCGTRYYEESKLTYKLHYNEQKMKSILLEL